MTASVIAQQSDADLAVGDEEILLLDEQVGHLLRKAHQRMVAIFQDCIEDPQLTPTQFSALFKLYEIGECSQNHLGRMTAMDPATIQGVIKRLGDRGLLTSRDDPKDRRRVLLSLSQKGMDLVKSELTNGFQIAEKVLSPLSDEEKDLFLTMLRRLG